MSDVLVVLPVLVPLLSAIGSMAAWRWLRVQQTIGVAGAGGGLVVAILLATAVIRGGPMATSAGGWPAPFGITLVADHLAVVMVAVAALMGAAVAVYAVAGVDQVRRRDAFWPLYHVLLAGVQGAFLTGDLFNLYVCFEVMLMASFVLLALGGDRPQMEGALTYVTLNLLSSAIFLAAVGLVYAKAHTLNLADLAARMPLVAAQRPELVAAVGGLLLVAFGIKAGLFPLYAWLPASYHAPPVAVSAIFAGLLTKVGVYAILRVMPLVFGMVDSIFRILMWAAVATMLAGVIGAMAQLHVRRILSFNIIGSIGYMALGLALVTAPDPGTRRLAVAAVVFYIAHHIVVKTNLFLVAGLVLRMSGSEDLKRIGGLATAAPWLAAAFLLPALSLAGIPPLSGFWAKLAVVRAALEAHAWWGVAVALVAGLLTLMSMVRVWDEGFWKAAPEGGRPASSASWWMVVPVVVLAALTVAIGLWPQPLFELAGRAADGILSADAYRAAVGLAAGGGP